MSLLNKNFPTSALIVHPKLLALTAVPTTISLVVKIVKNYPKIIKVVKTIKSEAAKVKEIYNQNVSSSTTSNVEDVNTEIHIEESQESEVT